MDKKVLPIFINHNIYSMLCYAFPLSIALAHEAFVPWVQENYIRCFGIELFQQRNVSPTFYIDATTYINFGNKELFSYNSYAQNMLSESDIVEIILTNINANRYCITLADEFFLPSCPMYEHRHFIHEQLVYGYDYQKKIFYSAGMDSSRHYACVEHSFESLVTAFKAGFLIDIHPDIEYVKNNYLFTISPMNTIREYPYSIMNFRDKLILYLNGTITESERFLLQVDTWGIPYAGIDFYEFIINSINNPDNRLLFRKIHHFKEHKEGLYQKMKYASGFLDDKGAAYLKTQNEMYKKEVADKFINIWNLCLKNQELETLGKKDNIPRNIERIHKELLQIKINESNIISNIISVL